MQFAVWGTRVNSWHGLSFSKPLMLRNVACLAWRELDFACRYYEFFNWTETKVAFGRKKIWSGIICTQKVPSYRPERSWKSFAMSVNPKFWSFSNKWTSSYFLNIFLISCTIHVNGNTTQGCISIMVWFWKQCLPLSKESRKAKLTLLINYIINNINRRR